MKKNIWVIADLIFSQHVFGGVGQIVHPDIIVILHTLL